MESAFRAGTDFGSSDFTEACSALVDSFASEDFSAFFTETALSSNVSSGMEFRTTLRPRNKAQKQQTQAQKATTFLVERTTFGFLFFLVFFDFVFLDAVDADFFPVFAAEAGVFFFRSPVFLPADFFSSAIDSDFRLFIVYCLFS